MTRQSAFRLFCYEKWFEHKDEIFRWEGKIVSDSPQQYFGKYKWFLKKLYKSNQNT